MISTSPLLARLGDGAFDFHWSHGFSAGEGLMAGTTLYAQFWYRDTAAPTGAALTDGLEFELCP